MTIRFRPARLRSSSSPLLMSLAALAVAMVALPGCYERVTRAKGFGADGVAVSEPYQETSKLDNWIFGEEPKRNKSILDRH